LWSLLHAQILLSDLPFDPITVSEMKPPLPRLQDLSLAYVAW